VTGQSPATAPARHVRRLGFRHVGGVDQAPARVDGALSSSHSTGRAPDQARQSSTSFTCSATWMWIGPPPASGIIAQFAGRHGAQAVRRDADDCDSMRERPCARLQQPRETIHVVDEAALAVAGAAPPKPEWA
jgi:hypothetical protein